MADRFNEMAHRYFEEMMESTVYFEDQLAAVLRKVHDEAANRAAHLTAQLAHAEADAEQAIHNEAFKEAQRIAEWLRTTSRAKGVLISIHASQDIARLADDVASMSYREPT